MARTPYVRPSYATICRRCLAAGSDRAWADRVLLADPAGQIQRVADFVGESLTAEELETAVRVTSIDSMREAMKPLDAMFRQAFRGGVEAFVYKRAIDEETYKSELDRLRADVSEIPRLAVGYPRYDVGRFEQQAQALLALPQFGCPRFDEVFQVLLVAVQFLLRPFALGDIPGNAFNGHYVSFRVKSRPAADLKNAG